MCTSILIKYLKLHGYENKNFFKNSKKIILPNPAQLEKIKHTPDSHDNVFKFLYVGEIEKHKGILFDVKSIHPSMKSNSEILYLAL